MKKKELFDKTVSILVNSFNNGTLAHHDGCGCAIGNIIAHYMGVQIIPKPNIGYETELEINLPKFIWSNGYQPYWTKVHLLGVMKDVDYTTTDTIHEYYLGLEQISRTGYTVEESCMIERAFESGLLSNHNDADGYYGLMNIIHTLQTIHKTDSYITANTRSKFIKKESKTLNYNLAFYHESQRVQHDTSLRVQQYQILTQEIQAACNPVRFNESMFHEILSELPCFVLDNI